MNKFIKSTLFSAVLALGIGFSTGASALIVTGSDNGSGDPSTVGSPAITAPSAGTVSFAWSYDTVDSPFWDPAGYFLDNDSNRFQFTDDEGASSQSGSSTFAVDFGQLYGFYVFSLDNLFGAATLQISDLVFTADNANQLPNEVPEPGSLALLGLGLMAMVAAKKRKQS
jgi:hypothetical protein